MCGGGIGKGGELGFIIGGGKNLLDLRGSVRMIVVNYEEG